MSGRKFTVLVPAGNGYSDPQNMTRVIEHLQQLGLAAEFESKDGFPVNTREAYTLVTKDDRAANVAPRVLETHYGFIVFPS